MNKAYLGLGTNMGDRLNYLNQACRLLNLHENISLTNKSSIYETKAWGYTEQNDFLNMCVEIETTLNAQELLKICNEIEEKLNRERVIRWGPRTIDIDILFFNDIILKEENLEIPHPRIQNRAFVLIPLMDINSNLNINNKSIDKYLETLTAEERDEVKEFIGNEQ